MHFRTSIWAWHGFARIRWLRLVMFVLIAIGATPARAQNYVFVDGVVCTLAQAIGLANNANGINPASIGSATTSFGGCTTTPPPITVPPPGPYELFVTQTQVTLTSIDNYWYGPNALPPIASAITIAGLGTGGTTQIVASHVGDPAPATANAFRFFYVSGGLEFAAGSLTLVRVILQGGYAKGGDSGQGGGGAGMGGAIFNQGNLALANVSLIGNIAQGGSVTCQSNCLSSPLGGGGIGHDGLLIDGGGFGWASAPGAFGGLGGFNNGGGGGFIAGSNGGTGAGTGGSGGQGGSGGGFGKLGGKGGDDPAGQTGGLGGDGGGGGGSETGGTGGPSGGNFGSGGGGGTDIRGGGGGGGVGGGGGSGFSVPAGGNPGGGAGGGFGGGGGATALTGGGGVGGFGGGGGSALSNGGAGGFGGGHDAHNGTGGSGMGGAVFNHAGTVSLENVTATGNAVRGGSGSPSCPAPCGGSGLGAVLFNLNGTVTIDFSTLAGNSLSGNNARADNFGPEDGTVYSLAYGDKIQNGTASSASLTIHSSIIHGTHADGGLQSDVSVNVVNGANTNTSGLVYAGKNFIHQSYTVPGVSQSGINPDTTPPLLGALSLYRSSPILLPVLPIGMDSPANDAAGSCLEADGSTTLTTDARGANRPYGSQCDVGAYEFDGDYIFAANNEPRL